MSRYRIGRADTNDVVLADPTVSREHAELVVIDGGRFQVKDLGSTYGVSVMQGTEWRKVTEAELRIESRLRIGEYETTVADLLRDTDRTVVRPHGAEHAVAPPRPAAPSAPAFRFPRDLPPEKRILVWLGAGFAGFLLIALITLIVALAL